MIKSKSVNASRELLSFLIENRDNIHCQRSLNHFLADIETCTKNYANCPSIDIAHKTIQNPELQLTEKQLNAVLRAAEVHHVTIPFTTELEDYISYCQSPTISVGTRFSYERVNNKTSQIQTVNDAIVTSTSTNPDCRHIPRRSPIALAFLGRHAGDSFLLNGALYRVITIA